MRNRIGRFMIALAVGALVLPAVSHATLIAYEGFDYPAGTRLTNSTTQVAQNGGTGWGGAWYGDASPAGVVSNGSLTYVGLKTTGNKATDPSSDPQYRYFDTAPGGAFNAYLDANGDIGKDNTTLWFSFAGYDNAGSWRPWQLTTNTSAGVVINVSDQLNGNWCFTSGSGYGGTDTGIPTGASNMFGVIRIDFLSGNDRAWLWVNPIIANGTPSIASANASVTNNFAFDGFRWSVGGVSGSSYVDEIRVGDSFASVVIPEPATLGMLGLGAISAFWLRRRRQD